MEQQGLFRKAALDKLASPERLDVLMQVTSPAGWLALWTIGAILVGVVYWSVRYTIAERVEGQGILITGGELRQVIAGGDGTLTALNLELNANVIPGDLVGEIAAGGGEEVDVARVRWEEARLQERSTVADREETFAKTGPIIAGYEAQIGETEAEVASVEAELARLQGLLERGLVTRPRVTQQEQLRLQLRSSVQSVRAQIAASEATLRRADQQVELARSRTRQAKANYDSVLATVQGVTQVRSTVEGRVIEVMKRVGDLVRRGEVLAMVEPPSQTLQPIVYISSDVAKRVTRGMAAEISPTNVEREEYGFMRGTVEVVGEYPVTPPGVMARIGNQALVNELLDGGSKLEVGMALQLASTPSGFQWSSSEGPPFKIEGGTRVNVSVIVERRAPITKVLPMVRGTLGLS